MEARSKKTILYLLPVVLTLTCTLVFLFAAHQFGPKRGYFIGFLSYWIVWCAVLPLLLLGPQAIVHFFNPSRLFDYKVILCLVGPLIFVYAYAFPKALKQADALVVVCSFFMALVNAALEEVLWRATYLQAFAGKRMRIGYASCGFAVWHYAPQVILANRNPGGAHSFVLFALVLGLCYSYAAWRQRSVFWTTLSHLLLDFAGLGALFYFK